MACALGFGAALLAGNGVAWADTPDSASGDRSGRRPAWPPGATPEPGGKTAFGVTRKGRPEAGVDGGGGSQELRRASARGCATGPPSGAHSGSEFRRTGPAGDAGARGIRRQRRRGGEGAEPLFNNQTPTLAYNALENNDANGQIGRPHPFDPDSETLTHTATTPAFGTVAVNPNGTFVHTPVRVSPDRTYSRSPSATPGAGSISTVSPD